MNLTTCVQKLSVEVISIEKRGDPSASLLNQHLRIANVLLQLKAYYIARQICLTDRSLSLDEPSVVSIPQVLAGGTIRY